MAPTSIDDRPILTHTGATEAMVVTAAVMVAGTEEAMEEAMEVIEEAMEDIEEDMDTMDITDTPMGDTEVIHTLTTGFYL